MESVCTQFPTQEEFIRHGPARILCRRCFSSGFSLYRHLGLPIHRYSDFVTESELKKTDELADSVSLDEISEYRLDGIRVGEHALAGALRYFAKGSLDDESAGEAVLHRYLKASLLTTLAAQRLLKTFSFDGACFHHGIYVPQGLIGETARQHEVHVVNWNPAYRKQCFIFSHTDTYHHTLMTEPTSAWENMHWTPEMEAELMDYLDSRRLGTKDWIFFHEKPESELEIISRDFGIDFSKPCIGMLTNVMWDAQLHYPANAFKSMLDWVLQTLNYFIKRPDLQLIIRVHPAEVRGTIPSRQPIVDEIRKHFPGLPKNIIVIPPETQVSTYAVMENCDSVIIYGTKTGVELSSLGIPVIVAGEAWIQNKGVTTDVHSAGEYFQILDRLPFHERMDEVTTRRARMYAYHFFFRRMIPLSMMEPVAGWPPYRLNISSIEDLKLGRDRGLDVICRGILEKSDFIDFSELKRTPTQGDGESVYPKNER